MHPTHPHSPWAALALLPLALLAAGGAQAQTSRACMIEADKRVMSRPAYTAECYEAAKGVRRAVIQDRCEGLGKTSTYFGGNDTLLTWLPQCPRRSADAVCRGTLDGDADVYYYDRGASALDALAEQCDDEGGRWTTLR